MEGIAVFLIILNYSVDIFNIRVITLKQIYMQRKHQSPSPYYIQTISGKLQLTKGAYLTLMKRKSSTIKTLCKTKPLALDDRKKTIKKQRNRLNRSKLIQSTHSGTVAMKKKNNKTLIYSVNDDKNIYQGQVVIPSIPMIYDNDNESEWFQIEETVKNMSLQLSVAMYDRNYGC